MRTQGKKGSRRSAITGKRVFRCRERLHLICSRCESGDTPLRLAFVFGKFRRKDPPRNAQLRNSG